MAQLQRKGDCSLDEDISSRSQRGTSAAESNEDNSTEISAIGLQAVGA